MTHDVIFPILLSLRIHEYTNQFVLELICAFVIAVLLALHWRRDAYVFAIALMSTAFAVFTLKEIFAVPRPDTALVAVDGYAFPSGHAAFTMFFAMTISWIIMRHARIRNHRTYILAVLPLFLVATIVGFSRIVIGVHTTAQVVGGFAIGIIIPLIVFFIQRKVVVVATEAKK